MGVLSYRNCNLCDAFLEGGGEDCQGLSLCLWLSGSTLPLYPSISIFTVLGDLYDLSYSAGVKETCR